MATSRKWEPRWTRNVSLSAGFRLVGMVAVVMEVSFRTSGVALASYLKPRTRVNERQLFFRGEPQRAQRRDGLDAHGKCPSGTSGFATASSLKPKTGANRRQLFLSGTTKDTKDTKKTLEKHRQALFFFSRCVFLRVLGVLC